MKTDVLIVGAGPTGLMLANILASNDIHFRVIERDPGPTEQSRAVLVHVRTLEYWDKLGLAQNAITNGVKIKNVKVFTNGKSVTNIPLGEGGNDRTPFPFALALPQGQTQRLLLQGLEGSGTEVEWETQLLSLSQTLDEVQTVVKRADGSQEVITAAWVIGTDGAKSAVRHNLNISFEGDTYEQVGFLADVEMDATFEMEALYLNLSHGGFVGISPLANNQFRLFGAMSAQLAAKVGLSENPDLTLADLQEWFDQYFFVGHTLTSLKWISAYRTHSRVVDHYQMGRCFLAGDAAAQQQAYRHITDELSADHSLVNGK